MNPTSTELPPPGSCPACGRYTGPASTCPYCEIELPGRGALRLLRWTALLFASLGLAMLLAVARRNPPPVIPVSKITAASTGRTRIRGVAVTQPRVVSRDGIPRFVSFDLQDNSGRITVSASRNVVRTLVAGNSLPAKGATIEVTGNPGIDKHLQMHLYMDAPPSLASTETSTVPAGTHPCPARVIQTVPVSSRQEIPL